MDKSNKDYNVIVEYIESKVINTDKRTYNSKGEPETAHYSCGKASKMASKIRMGSHWHVKEDGTMDVYAFGKLCLTFGS